MPDTKHTEGCAIHGCEGWNGTRYCDCGAETKQDAERQRLQEYDVRPFDKLPGSHADHVNQWLASNKKKPAEVRWSLYPIGMVGRWIERAETAEARASQEPRPQGEWKSLFHDLWGMWHKGVAYDQQIKDKWGKLLFLLTDPRPAGGELREIAERFLDAAEGEQLAAYTRTTVINSMAAFAASERGQAGNGYALCKEDGIKMYIGVTDFMLGWTAKPEEALYLSRRADADKLAEICDDAWTVESLPLPAPPAEKGEGR